MENIATANFIFEGNEGGETELLLTRVLALILFIIVGSLVYWVINKWFISPKKKESKDYEKNKYKDIEGC